MKARVIQKPPLKREAPFIPPPEPEKPAVKRVLTRLTAPARGQVELNKVILRIISLAQVLKERQFYPYQVEPAYRLVESLLLRDNEAISILMARQSGKTELFGGLVSAMMIILPVLSKEYPDSWLFNLTDDHGVYRGFADGFACGIYASRMDQAEIMFERVKMAFATETGKKILREAKISVEERNGDTLRLSNGSRVLCKSASEQSKIEGETHHLLVIEEAQDISDVKVRKSLQPMVSSTGGTIVKVGTAGFKKCDFYQQIQLNQRLELFDGRKNHFFYPYTVAVKYNSLYANFIRKEILRLGEDSDEFRISYLGQWVFERGMFVTQEQLFHKEVAHTTGLFSERFPRGLPKTLAGRDRYSIVAGIDWGSAADSTVVTLGAVDWNNPLESGKNSIGEDSYYTFYEKHIIDWLEFLGDNYEYQFWEIVAYLNSVYRLRKIVTDSNTAGKPIFDRLAATYRGSDIEVEDFNFSAKVKSDGYKSYYSDLCGKRLTFPCSQVTTRTMQWKKFTGQMLDAQKEYQNGLMKVAHPNERHCHDDYPDSGMMMAWGMNKPAGTSEIDYQDTNFFYTVSSQPHR